MKTPTLRGIVVLGATVVVAVIGARAGLWQLERARQKIEWQAQIDARAGLPVLAQAELAGDGVAAAAQYQRRVQLHGRWLSRATVYLENRSQLGHAGFIVVTPLELAAGDAVLVQRGWAPRDAADPRRTPPVETPAGPVDVLGIVAPPPYRVYELGADDLGPIRQNLDPAQFAREIGVALRPLSVQQLDPPGALPSEWLQRRWPPPTADIAKHQGYALQWFALAALAIGLYVWFQFIHPRRLARTRPSARPDRPCAS